MLANILKLGSPELYQQSCLVKKNEVFSLLDRIDYLNQLLLEFRHFYGVGRGIAAPQIGLMKRIICLNLDGMRYTLINPYINNMSDDTFELWDDCMCFPNLLVKVKRHRSCTVTYVDENWMERQWNVEDDMAELIQHEHDHLDGILATQRAIDDKSFKIN